MNEPAPSGAAQAKALQEYWTAGEIPRPTKGEAEEIQLIDLRLLDASPLHHRKTRSAEEMAALTRSIEVNGLKDPIEVRPVGDRFQIICGHRRHEAFMNLLNTARTEGERAKYRAIPARVRSGASDSETVRLGIAEDLLREEFPPGDAAASLETLRQLEPTLSSAKKLSEATGVPFKRAARYLQLGKAAEVVQEATQWGIMVEVDGSEEDQGGVQYEKRKLDLRAALEFDRLHASLSAKKGADASDGSDAQDEPYPDRETRKAIERALEEEWSYRQVKQFVDKTISPADTPANKKAGRPRVPFKWNKRRLQVDVDQLDALDASQKQELLQVIEEIRSRLQAE